MSSSLNEKESDSQQGTLGLLLNLPLIARLLDRLNEIFRMTEEEQEEAGIYLDHPGGESIL